MSTTAFLWVLLAVVTVGSLGGLSIAKLRFHAKYDRPKQRSQETESAAAR